MDRLFKILYDGEIVSIPGIIHCLLIVYLGDKTEAEGVKTRGKDEEN